MKKMKKMKRRNKMNQQVIKIILICIVGLILIKYLPAMIQTIYLGILSTEAFILESIAKKFSKKWHRRKETREARLLGLGDNRNFVPILSFSVVEGHLVLLLELTATNERAYHNIILNRNIDISCYIGDILISDKPGFVAINKEEKAICYDISDCIMNIFIGLHFNKTRLRILAANETFEFDVSQIHKQMNFIYGGEK